MQIQPIFIKTIHLNRLFPIQNYFSKFTAFHHIKTLLGIINSEPVCNNRREVNASY